MPPPRIAALVPQPRGPRADNNNKYDPEHCWTVRQLAQEGKFPEEWCAHLGVTYQTIYNWADRHPEFEEACMIGWYLLRAYWTDKARNSIQGVGMPPSVLIKILESRFPDTWGKTNPRNTQETFENRPGRPIEGGADGERRVTPEEMKAMSPEDIRARIEVLQRRREAERKA